MSALVLVAFAAILLALPDLLVRWDAHVMNERRDAQWLRAMRALARSGR